jgi:ATP-citrate lyase alpha-subunit
MTRKVEDLKGRKHSQFTSSLSGDKDGEPYILNKKLIDWVEQDSFAKIVGSMLIGKKIKSEKTEEFIDLVLKIFVDHGPYVSGAVNSMITARAGKDMVSSLASGLLTVGPRFGGAIDGAAKTWYKGANEDTKPGKLVEEYAKNKKYIKGIGHRKYRIDIPDPRVELIKEKVKDLDTKYLDFALGVEKVTTSKKPNLILNVDGIVAAVVLDLLETEEELSPQEIQSLIDAGFFNAFFILSRSVGFVSHYLDQRKLGEKLFRLTPDDVLTQFEE